MIGVTTVLMSVSVYYTGYKIDEQAELEINTVPLVSPFLLARPVSLVAAGCGASTFL